MSNFDEKQRWNCPGCQRRFVIAPGRSAPELCPDCRNKPRGIDVTVNEPPAVPKVAEVAPGETRGRELRAASTNFHRLKRT